MGQLGGIWRFLLAEMPKGATVKPPSRGDKPFRPDFKITTNLFCNFASVNKERKFQFNTKKRSGNKPSPFFVVGTRLNFAKKSQIFCKIALQFCCNIFPRGSSRGESPSRKTRQTAIKTVAAIAYVQDFRTLTFRGDRRNLRSKSP